MASYVLLDGHSLAYRAWFALKETGMRTASGQETQAVFGFVSMVTKLLDDLRPDGLAVAFDRPEPTFRDEISPDYKAGRAATPEPLREQIGLIRQFCGALAAPVYNVAGFEADDIIGTLATRLRDAGEDLVIVTGDRDAYQLVQDPHVRVLYNRRGVTDYVLYDEAGILERTGVRPTDYPLLAALRGDPSDNLPGVPGVGEKTAARLVNDHGDLEGIFASLGSLSPKLAASLAAAEEQVRRNFALTPIVRDVPLELELDAWQLAGADREELGQMLGFLELRAPRDRLFAVLDVLGGDRHDTAATVTDIAVRPVRVLADHAALEAFAHDAAGTGPKRALVIEPTWAGTPGRSAIVGVAFALDGADEDLFLPGELVDDPASAAILGAMVSGEGGTRVVANRAKELMRALLPLGVDITGLSCDTAVVAYLLEPTLGQDSLEEVASRRGLSLGGASVPASGQLGFDLGDESAGDVAATTARRAEVIGVLAHRLLAELSDSGERSLYEEVERPLVRVLAKMEVAGVAVDVALLTDINAELSTEARTLEQRVYEIAGAPFNLNSPPQLRVVLYETLGLRPQRKTKTGYSTDAQTLEKLRDADQSGIVDVLLRYREVEKLRSTYGTGLLAEVAPDGRIHASFNQTVARTGRLSSDAPNLHNIPVRTDGGRRFREAFIPAPGSVFLVADYNQIELRVIAHLAQDPGLTAAFEEGRDIHAATAAGIYGVEASDVTSAMRAKAKMVSYGLAYGMEAYGLAQRLAIGVDEASEILEQYFRAFPAVRSYMEATVAQARVRGYTETERGRRRYLPELASDNFRVRQAAERQAMNAGIQGLAADIFKIALVRLDDALERAHLASRLVLQVHDEVVLEVPEAEREAARALTEDAMAHAYPLAVPLEAHIAFGDTWGGAKPA